MTASTQGMCAVRCHDMDELDAEEQKVSCDIHTKRRKVASEADTSDGMERQRQRVPGPTTLDGLMSWSTQFLSQCQAFGLGEHIRSNLSRGVNLFSDYSGMGSFEQCAKQLRESLDHLGMTIGHGFKSIRACDSASIPRQLLETHTEGPEKPRHVFKDVLEQVPEKTLEVIDRIHTWYKARYDERLASGEERGSLQRELGREMVSEIRKRLRDVEFGVTGRCSVHGSCCPLVDEDACIVGGVSFWCAGTTCTDHTSTNQNHPGVFGRTIIPLLVWCQAVATKLPDVVLHECTPLFPVWILELFFEEHYRIHSRVWCPTDAGIPMRRKRVYTLCFRRGTMMPVAPNYAYDCQGFEDMFFRDVAVDASVFFWAGSKQSRRMVDCLAHARKIFYESTDDVSVRDVMPPSHVERLDAYIRLAKQDVHSADAAWFANLTQSPDSRKALAKDILPSMLRGTRTFLLPVGKGEGCARYMEPSECMSSLLLPTHTWGGSATSTDLIGPPHALCFADGISRLSFTQVRALCGNGMSLIQLGACMLVALGTYVKVDPLHVPRPWSPLRDPRDEGAAAEDDDGDLL